MTEPTNPSVLNSSLRRGHITIILATRSRPEMLREVFDSLGRTTMRKDKTDIWLYVDADDCITREAIEKNLFPDPGFPVHWHIGPQMSGLGDPYQVLWKATGQTAEVYLSSVDDIRFETPGWDEIVRTEFGRFPDGVLLGFAHDPLTADQATYPIFGGGWIAGLGRVYSGYFPYWFDDRWVEQIALMAGRLTKVSMTLFPIRGKGRTKRMRNMPFWTRFLQLTLPERIASARKLIELIHANDAAARRAALENLERVAAELRKEQEKFSDIYAVFQEERHSELMPEQRKAFSQLHYSCETKAVERLIIIAQNFMAKGEYDEAVKCLDAVNLSDLRVRQVQEMKVECLRRLGKTAEAKKISAENLAAWPEMNFARRVFRFLGMVANDGKRMLIGLFNKNPLGKKS